MDDRWHKIAHMYKNLFIYLLHRKFKFDKIHGRVKERLCVCVCIYIYIYIYKTHTHIFKEKYTKYLLSKYAKLSIHTHKNSLLSAELEQTLFGLHDTKMTQENLPLKKQICFHVGSPKWWPLVLFWRKQAVSLSLLLAQPKVKEKH